MTIQFDHSIDKITTTIFGQEIITALQQAQTNANSALNLSQASYARANLSVLDAGDAMTGTLTVPSLTSNGTIFTDRISANTIITSQSFNSIGTILVDRVSANTIITSPTFNATTSVLGAAITSNTTVSAGGNVSGTNLVLTGSVNSATALVTPVTVAGTYSLSLRDNGNIVTFNNTSSFTVNTNINFPIGYRTVLVQLGTGNVIINANVNTTVNKRGGSNTRILGQYGEASLIVYAANTFLASGELHTG